MWWEDLCVLHGDSSFFSSGPSSVDPLDFKISGGFRILLVSTTLWRKFVLTASLSLMIVTCIWYSALAAESAIHGFDLREKSDIELHLSFAGMISIHAYERKYYKEAVADLESRNLSVELKRRCSF
ncbi:hypothetical protein SDJN03_13907, partial [Cucurbita argyrosperma subsp. sororia]